MVVTPASENGPLKGPVTTELTSETSSFPSPGWFGSSAKTAAEPVLGDGQASVVL